MIINANNLDIVFRGFKAVYKGSFDETTALYTQVAMTVPSTTGEEEYGWLGQSPSVRQWLGERHVHNLRTHGFTIKNLDFESTVSVPRNSIEDDNVGVYRPMFQEMGRATKQHPDQVVFDLLSRGFTTNCYDGQFYFDTDHPEYGPDGQIVSTSNFQAGASTPWYLMDLSKPIKPMIWQHRKNYEFTALMRPEDPNVFFKKEYIFGTDARVNAGFGLWQLAYGSKAALTIANFKAARLAMTEFKGDRDRRLGIAATHLIVPPSLEETAKEMFKPNLAGGESNIWANTVQIIVSHDLN